MVQMIEYGHAPLATGPEDGSQASEGRVDTGGSDWSGTANNLFQDVQDFRPQKVFFCTARCGFEPPAEREPLAQALLAHAVEAAAAAADAQVGYRSSWSKSHDDLI